jgi:SAM-dependent methyltransferase
MRHFIPTYLEPLLSKDWDIVSIGCGSGIDVEMLRRDGYKAYGFDPGRHAHFSLRDDEVRPFLRSGGADDHPFGDQRFDFAYALEVIEHVGCWEFGTRLRPSWREERLSFLRSSLALLRSPGRLLLSTSNRLCPIDPGHDHRYSVVGRLATRLRLPFGISIPWHRQNFLYSFNQLAADIRSIDPGAAVATASIGRYPTITGRRNVAGSLVKTFLASLDFELLRRSPAVPLLVAIVEI